MLLGGIHPVFSPLRGLIPFPSLLSGWTSTPFLAHSISSSFRHQSIMTVFFPLSWFLVYSDESSAYLFRLLLPSYSIRISKIFC